MEKVTSKVVNKCQLYSWRFTQEERENFKEALVRFPAEKVEGFLADLQLVCWWARAYQTKRGDVTFQRTERKKMLRQFEKTCEYLETLVDRKIEIQETKSILEIGIVRDDVVLEKDRLHWLMLGAAMKLREAVSIIKNDQGEPGRPSGRAVTGDLTLIIANRFQCHLGKPTAKGSFYSVVQLAFNACGLPLEYPDRHIKSALKRL